MPERRYSEEEVAAIFASAARPGEAKESQIGAGAGMTLAELQEIGREVGLSSGDVARAAASLDAIAPPATRRYFGLPLAVGRSVDLERRLSEAEWEQLVIDLRTTFHARGFLQSQGNFRQWSNGNLHALLEPTPTGQRLRLQTLKESARNWMAAGITTCGAAAGLFILGTFTGAGLTPAIGTAAVVGLGMFGAAAVRLPTWAQRRRRQFDEVIARLLASMQRDHER